MSEARVIDPVLPRTAIVLGAGCSVGLGVPAMANFMDRAFTELGKAATGSENIRTTLSRIVGFTRFVKSSAASVDARFLDVEQLYGLAEMATDLKLTTDLKPELESVQGVLTEFKRLLMFMTIEAGSELVSSPEYKQLWRAIDVIKRESHTEDPGGFSDRGSKHANLMAYLSLASFRDSNPAVHPMILQFNWDLALDRAYYLRYYLCSADEMDREGARADGGKDRRLPWMCYGPEKGVKLEHFEGYPLVVRPHGGVHMCRLGSEELEAASGGWMSAMGYDTEMAVWRERAVSGMRAFQEEAGKEQDQIRVFEKAIVDWKVRPAEVGIEDPLRRGDFMAIEPPTWKKDVNRFLGQWHLFLRYSRSLRRLVFIGYSLPRSDLYFRHYLALSLAQADYVPEVYVWNPEMRPGTETWCNYKEIFAPLQRQGRLYAIDKPFGDPALFDLERALHLAERVS